MTAISARPAQSATAKARPTFARDEGFRREVTRRVNAHFERTGRSPRADARMIRKTVVCLTWFAASYALLVFAAASWWQAVLASLSLALATAAVGFNVQHDANHGAFSNDRRVNHVVGLTMDLLGASSYVWRSKHNIFHHTYTNVEGADSDIDLGLLARLSPAQRRRPWHGLQHVYLWPLYGFLLPVLHFFHDARCLVTGRIAGHRFPRPRGLALLELVAGKLVFLGYAFVLPALFHPWWLVLLFYGFTAMVVGLILSVVFQMAHCVQEASFPELPAASRQMPSAWAVHQVQTTVDFARENRLLAWYLGGLNFQIEHHLFPRVCHVHYPDIAPIVEETCRDYGIRYAAHDTFGAAIASHFHLLRRLGRPPAQEVPS